MECGRCERLCLRLCDAHTRHAGDVRDSQRLLRDVNCQLPLNSRFQLLTQQSDVAHQSSAVRPQRIIVANQINEIGLQGELNKTQQNQDNAIKECRVSMSCASRGGSHASCVCVLCPHQ